jgi:pilus assembly protein Flp/PilA
MLREDTMGIMNFFKNFLKDEEGATAVEYAVMLVLIIVVAIVVIETLGNKVNIAFNAVADAMPS